MTKYAIICKGLVIDILFDGMKPEFPPDSEGNEVFAVACGSSVTIGMYYSNGKFTVDEPVDMPSNIELMLMKTQAAIYEELQENRLSQMKANADIYEAILSNGGNV
ncbi:hypothetical protein [Anaerotignum sp.]|uniref:hypothetical protein n=1 Tax=Anaerotignum sp. TaxID=2039241 RepID=UPI0028A02C6B|nr:hypothetical protein [Anaerotignum sp.]